MKWHEILTWIDGVSYISDWKMALCGKYSLITSCCVVHYVYILCMYLQLVTWERPLQSLANHPVREVSTRVNCISEGRVRGREGTFSWQYMCRWVLTKHLHLAAIAKLCEGMVENASDPGGFHCSRRSNFIMVHFLLSTEENTVYLNFRDSSAIKSFLQKFKVDWL